MWLRVREATRRPWLRALGLAALVGMLGLLALAGAFRTLYSAQLDGSSHAGALEAGSVVCQTFVAQYGGLSQIEVQLVTFGRELENQGAIVLHLKESPESTEDLAESTVGLSSVRDNSFQAFAFDPVHGAVGRELCFCLELTDLPEAATLSVGGSEADVYPEGAALFLQADGRGLRDLAFRVRYAPSLSQRLGLLPERITNAKPYLAGDIGLYIILGVAAAGLLGGLLALLIDDRAPEDGRPR